MAVVCSGFSYDMDVVSHGFVTDISKTDAENKVRLHALIDDAEVPGERMAKLFELEVLPPRLVRSRKTKGRREDRGAVSLIRVSGPIVIYLFRLNAMARVALRLVVFMYICLFLCSSFFYFL